MKTRLIIASLSLFAVTLVVVMTTRPSAVAQEDSSQEALVPEDETQAADTAGAPTSVAETLSSVSGDTAEGGAENPSASQAEASAAAEGEGERSEADASPVRSEISASSSVSDAASTGDGSLPDEGTVESGQIAADATADGASAEQADGVTFEFTALEEEQDAAVRSEGEETLSVDFPSEEIRVVLRIVADLFDLNLVIPEQLTGRASIKLHDVTWRQVFDVVLSPVGFTYVEDGNIIKVVSLESLTLEPPVTTVRILDFAQAEDVVGTIQPLVNAQNGGRVQVDKRSNALVITERPTQLRRIENIIAALDKPNVQVMIESKFIETRNNAIENIGVNWASLDGYEVTAGPFTHQYERDRVRTDVKDRERSSDSSQSSSFSNTTTNGVPTTTTTNQSGASQAASRLDGLFETDETGKLTTAVFSADEFNIILSALRTTNDVKLVSNPTVVTMNNRQASIHIGEEFPIVLPRFNDQTGTYEAGEYQTVDVGIKLNVTPQVNNAGFINMQVEPDVSTLASTITYFGAEYPVRATRNAKSFVTVKDGFTVAIGGLLQEDTMEVQTKVPVLGSIPVLGRLFRSDSNSTDQRNLIIFLTARTLSPEGTMLEDTVDPRMIHRMGIKREEVPGYRPEIPHWPDHPADQPLVEEIEADQVLAPDPNQPVVPDPVLEAGTSDRPAADSAEPTPAPGTEAGAVSDIQSEPAGQETAESAAESDSSDAGADIKFIQTSAPDASAGTGDRPEAPAEPAAPAETQQQPPAQREEPEAQEEKTSRRSSGWLTP